MTKSIYPFYICYLSKDDQTKRVLDSETARCREQDNRLLYGCVEELKVVVETTLTPGLVASQST